MSPPVDKPRVVRHTICGTPLQLGKEKGPDDVPRTILVCPHCRTAVPTTDATPQGAMCVITEKGETP
jgi:hypothetical protein